MFTDKNNEDLLHDFLDIPSESIRKITINNPEILPDAIGEETVLNALKSSDILKKKLKRSEKKI